MTKITYIWHDCFVVERPQYVLIFDYWRDPITDVQKTDTDKSYPSFLSELPEEKPLYIIVSHHHKDHFNKDIFKWGEKVANIRYIISKDVRRHIRYLLNPESTYSGSRPDPDRITVLDRGEIYEDSIIQVEAFGSTDIGNSYCVTDKEGVSIFHAGDLNAWIWKDESTDKEVAEALEKFRSIVGEISEKHSKIDYAMFPVDSRIGRDYFTGAGIFVREIEIKHFFPMHFGLGETPCEQQRYRRDAARIELYANPERGEYICLQAPYSSYAKY